MTDNRMYTVQMVVTPEQARIWLATQRKNRHVRPTIVSKYAAVMAQGDWRDDTNESIALDKNGSLIDGQHRLLAILEYGKPVSLCVTFNAGSHIGEVIPRGARDIASIVYGVDMDSTEVAIARILCMPRRPTVNEIIQTVNKYYDAIGFVCNKARNRKRYVVIAPVLVAAVKAYYHEDTDRLSEFLDVLQSGISRSEADSTAILLREYLIREKPSRGERREEATAKSMAAIRAFCAGIAFKKLKPVQDIYPLPKR